MNKILRRLKEPSTVRGLFMLSGVIGFSISPELQEQIIIACAGMVGIIGIFTGDSTES